MTGGPCLLSSNILSIILIGTLNVGDITPWPSILQSWVLLSMSDKTLATHQKLWEESFMLAGLSQLCLLNGKDGLRSWVLCWVASPLPSGAAAAETTVVSGSLWLRKNNVVTMSSLPRCLFRGLCPIIQSTSDQPSFCRAGCFCFCVQGANNSRRSQSQRISRKHPVLPC